MRVNGSRSNGWDGERYGMGEFWPVPDVLAYLTGRWRVARSVRDLASGEQGEFTGTTVFTAEENGGLLEGGGLLQGGGCCTTSPARSSGRASPGPPNGRCGSCRARAARRTCGSRTGGRSTTWT